MAQAHLGGWGVALGTPGSSLFRSLTDIEEEFLFTVGGTYALTFVPFGVSGKVRSFDTLLRRGVAGLSYFQRARVGHTIVTAPGTLFAGATVQTRVSMSALTTSALLHIYGQSLQVGDRSKLTSGSGVPPVHWSTYTEGWRSLRLFSGDRSGGIGDLGALRASHRRPLPDSRSSYAKKRRTGSQASKTGANLPYCSQHRKRHLCAITRRRR